MLSSSREAINSNFAIIGLTRLGIKPEFLAEADALIIKLLLTLKQYFSDCVQIVPRHCMLNLIFVEIQAQWPSD